MTEHNRLTFRVTVGVCVCVCGGGGGGVMVIIVPPPVKGIIVLDSEVSTLKTVMFPKILFLKADNETCDTLY